MLLNTRVCEALVEQILHHHMRSPARYHVWPFRRRKTTIQTHQSRRALSAFASEPLITPERLTQDDWEDAFRIMPDWAALGGLVRPDEDLPPEDNPFCLYVGKKRKAFLFVDTAITASLCELTRFGGEVATNINSKANKPQLKLYAKVTFTGAAGDNVMVGRLVMDADAYELGRVD